MLDRGPIDTVAAVELPETKYAETTDGVHIAYQVFGEGERDLLLVHGFVSNVDMGWEDPHLAHFLRDLGSFTRLIQFDKRGTGVSDREVPVATLEERMDDLRAVMDAANSERAVVMGISEGVPHEHSCLPPPIRNARTHWFFTAEWPGRRGLPTIPGRLRPRHSCRVRS